MTYVGSNLTPSPLRDAVGYRGTSLIRKRTPLVPYRRPMPRVLGVAHAAPLELRVLPGGRGAPLEVVPRRAHPIEAGGGHTPLQERLQGVWDTGVPRS